MEAAGRRGLGDGVGKLVRGQVCFSWNDNSFSMTGVGDLKTSAGSAPPLPERPGRRTSSGLPGLPAKPIFRTFIYLANFLINLPCGLEPPET